MKNDDYYTNFVQNTHFLSQSTKDTYIGRLKIIRNDIFKDNIETILSRPDEFDKKLKYYCSQTKGRTGQSLGHHTIDAYYSAIMSLFIYNQDIRESNPELYTEWKKLHEKIREPISNKYKSNEPTERQKNAYVSYDEVVEIRNRLPIGSPERLLLMMYTEIPPVRSDYYKTKIVDKLPESESNDNLIVIDEKKSFIVLKKYKTSKKYGIIYIDLPNTLVKEIQKSLKLNPREYLFVSSRTNAPYNVEGTFNTWANRTLKTIFGKKNFSMTMLRHIYISRRDLKLEEQSGLDQEKIAKLMGHSIEQQRKYMWHTWLKKDDISP
jgi:tetrahydromethanopterin S-methyltransferase subunit G